MIDNDLFKDLNQYKFNDLLFLTRINFCGNLLCYLTSVLFNSVIFRKVAVYTKIASEKKI